MQAEIQQQDGGSPVHYTECSVCYYLPCGQVAYVGIRCKQPLAPSDRVQALETGVAEG